MNEVVIALITDKNYIMQTEVCIQSICRNKKSDSIYKIFVIGDNVDENACNKLKQLSYYNCDISIMSVNNKYRELHNINRYVTNASFLKFDIPFLLPNFDKIIYLDVDIIVQNDLSEFYNTDIKDTYAGVVEDITMKLFNKRHLSLGLEKYFNSGMMLLNALKIREEKLNEKMLNIYIKNGQNFYSHDQDVLNIAFNDNITILPMKYNWLISVFEFSAKNVRAFYGESTLEKPSDISIIHYVRNKPWEYSTVKLGEIWRKYYKLSSYGHIKLKLKTCRLLNLYYYLRGHLMLKKINDFIRKIRGYKL